MNTSVKLSKLLPVMLFFGCDSGSPSVRAEPTRPLPYLAEAMFPPTATDCSAAISFTRDDSTGAEAGLVRTDSGHSFYSYHPASRDPAEAPLVVVTNGGLTSSIMLAGGVGPRTVVLEGQVLGDVTENPASWTRFAHLLFVDPPTAGYGYPIPPSEQPEDELWGFTTGGEEAIDVATIVLSFLECRDVRPDRPVVLVGESAGGARTAHMLHQLRRAASGTPDPTLPPAVDEAWTTLVRSHFDRIAAGRGELEHARAPEYVARQFFAWVLIQPALPNGRVQALEQHDTRIFERLARSRSFEDYDGHAVERGGIAITSPEESRALLGVDIAAISALAPVNRTGARRIPRGGGSSLVTSSKVYSDRCVWGTRTTPLAECRPRLPTRIGSSSRISRTRIRCSPTRHEIRWSSRLRSSSYSKTKAF